MTLAPESEIAALSEEERAWLIVDERRWARAFEIAAKNPGVDAGGVYRVLRNLEKSPTERLRAALDHGASFFRVQRG